MKRILIFLVLAISSLTALATPPRLAVEQLFDGRFNNEKSVRTSIIKSNGVYFRSLKFTDNPDIVNTIDKAVHKDSSRAANFFEQNGEGGHSTLIKIVNNDQTIDIVFQYQNGSGFFVIRGPEEAFK
ncbi:MAG: hypothetical protein K2M00_07695 [Muribaculaceae bacterium]|nr:hypothetical protein [Muribaculaceae bacterium]